MKQAITKINARVVRSGQLTEQLGFNFNLRRATDLDKESSHSEL